MPSLPSRRTTVSYGRDAYNHGDYEHKGLGDYDCKGYDGGGYSYCYKITATITATTTTVAAKTTTGMVRAGSYYPDYYYSSYSGGYGYPQPRLPQLRLP